MFYAPFVRCEILQFRYPAPVIIRYQRDEDLREVDPCDERSKRDHQNKQDLLIKTKVPDVRQQFVEIYVFRLFFDTPVCFSRLRVHRVATGHRVILAVVQMNGSSKFLLRWHFLGNHKLIDRFERKSDRLSLLATRSLPFRPSHHQSRFGGSFRKKKSRILLFTLPNTWSCTCSPRRWRSNFSLDLVRKTTIFTDEGRPRGLRSSSTSRESNDKNLTRTVTESG